MIYAFRLLVAVLPAGMFRLFLNLVFPSKTVIHERGPYLSRWIIRQAPDGSADVLHFFHISDHGEEMHNHPWSGEGVILAWGYSDERRTGPNGTVHKRVFPFGAKTWIQKDTYHRATLLRPEKGAWTFFHMGPRGEDWMFLHPDGSHESLHAAVTRRSLPGPVFTRPLWKRGSK